VRGEDEPNERNPEFESKKLPLDLDPWQARFHNYGTDAVAATAYVEYTKLADVP
jgi:hypothetical protein